MKLKLTKNRVLEFKVYSVPDLPTMGVVNELEDGYYVLMLDYDGVDYDAVLRDLRHLHMVFGLCTFAVLVNNERRVKDKWGGSFTAGNYNVIGLDRMYYAECLAAMRHTRCDSSFRNNAGYYARRNWDLRLLEKRDRDGRICKAAPKLKRLIHHPGTCYRTHSTAVKDLLEVHFGAKVPRLAGMDGLRELSMIYYQTRRKKEEIRHGAED